MRKREAGVKNLAEIHSKLGCQPAETRIGFNT